eukprot:GGOE01018912.1.p1 GENE.GGOE01018912.1~~GGOE01018912.1.p1  ORF type:complete len:325 (-),score=74.93 GGOE01018912.1:174-1148(-)
MTAVAERIAHGTPLGGPSAALVEVACALVALGGRDEALWLALGDSLLACGLAELSAPQLAALAGAYASVGVCHYSLLSAVAVLLAEPGRLQGCGLSPIAEAMWGFAKLQVRDVAAARAILDHVVAQGVIQAAPPATLVRLTLAMAKLPLPHAPVMRAAATCLAGGAMAGLTAPQVSDVLWSFAKLNIHDAPLLAAAAQLLRTDGILSQSTPKSAANTLWALAKLGASCPDVVAAVAADMRDRGLAAQCWAMELHAVAWALATLGHRDEALMYAIADGLIRDESVLQTFSAEALGSLRWAFQRLRVPHPKLLEAIAMELRRQQRR